VYSPGPAELSVSDLIPVTFTKVPVELLINLPLDAFSTGSYPFPTIFGDKGLGLAVTHGTFSHEELRFFAE